MEDLSKIFAAFMDFYQPAESVQESDELLSTTDIKEKIDELTGEEVEEKLVFHYLIENNFEFRFTVEGFRWMMKIKQSKGFA